MHTLPTDLRRLVSRLSRDEYTFWRQLADAPPDAHTARVAAFWRDYYARQLSSRRDGESEASHD